MPSTSWTGHIMAHLSKAIDEVRTGEARVLKRPENLTAKQDSAPCQTSGRIAAAS